MQEQSTEIWRDVVGFENLYEVSGHGNVRRSLNARTHSRTKRGRLLKPAIDKYGYLRLCLYRADFTQTYHSVHRLVARAFLGEPPEGRNTVNHRDGDKWNNCPANLEWASMLVNRRHAIHTGLWHAAKGEKSGGAKLTESIVRDIRSWEGRASRADVAARFGISRRNVGMIWTRATWAHVQ